MKYGYMETTVGKRFCYVYGFVIKTDSGEIINTVDWTEELLSKAVLGDFDLSLCKVTDLEEARTFVASARGNKDSKLRHIIKNQPFPFSSFSQEYVDRYNRDIDYIFGKDLGIINKPTNLNLGIIKPG